MSAAEGKRGPGRPARPRTTWDAIATHRTATGQGGAWEYWTADVLVRVYAVWARLGITPASVRAEVWELGQWRAL